MDQSVLGNSTTESQCAAIELAEEIGGIVDSHTSLTHGPSKIGAQLVGKVTCTLGEVRNRADLLTSRRFFPSLRR